MQKEILYNCFDNSNALDNTCLKDIESLLGNAPYFQPGWMLLAKAKSKTNAPDYKKTLSQTAARVYNREQLFDFIYAEETEQTELKQTPLVKESPVKQKETSAQLEEKVEEKLELKPKVKTDLKPQVKPKIKAADKAISPKPIKKENGEELKSKEDLRTVVKERLAEIDKEKKSAVSEEKVPESKKIISDEKSTVEIIDSFIKQNPVINKPRDAEYKEEIEVAARSLDEKFDFVSETLAEINLKQGHTKKAIKIYEKLSLKYPEKSSYFAAQIKKINTSK